MVRYLGQKDKKLSVPTLERRFYGIPVGVRIRPRALSSKNLPAQGSICFKSQNFSPPTDFFEVQQFSHTHTRNGYTVAILEKRGLHMCAQKFCPLFVFLCEKEEKFSCCFTLQLVFFGISKWTNLSGKFSLVTL